MNLHLPEELAQVYADGDVIVLQRGFPVMTGPLHLIIAALAERDYLINTPPPTETRQ